jgi:hypothetical protein
MTQDDARMNVLRMIEEGQITADEGLRLLGALGTQPPRPPDPALPPLADARGQPADPQMRYWRNWWTLPMLAGVGVLVLGALAMYSAVQASGYGFWFVCSWLPFLIGVAIAALAWASRTSRWVHLRVEKGSQGGRERPRRLMLSFPIPVKVIAWAIRSFGTRIPALARTSVDELITAIDETATPERPIFIDVHKGEKGERVQVYIG